MFWWVLLGVVVLTVLGVAVVRWLAAGQLARLVHLAEDAVQRAVGGQASLEVEGRAVDVLLGLRSHRLPTARLVVTGARVPDGLAIDRAELTTTAGRAHGRGEVLVTTAALAAALHERGAWASGLRVRGDGQRLRLRVGPASVAVELHAVDGRVAVRVPIAAPPLGGLVDAALSELVPRPPEGVTVQQVRVEGEAVVATLDVDVLTLAAPHLPV